MYLLQHYTHTSQSASIVNPSQGRTRTLVDVRAVSLLARLLALLLFTVSGCFALPCGLLGSFGGLGCLRFGWCLGSGGGRGFASSGSGLQELSVLVYMRWRGEAYFGCHWRWGVVVVVGREKRTNYRRRINPIPDKQNCITWSTRRDAFICKSRQHVLHRVYVTCLLFYRPTKGFKNRYFGPLPPNARIQFVQGSCSP
jgi:hypothetical protein